MRILEFENHHFGVEDIKEALTEMGHELTVVSTPLFLERASEEFDKLFEEQITGQHYDAVFSFNYSAAVSTNCNRPPPPPPPPATTFHTYHGYTTARFLHCIHTL